MWKTSIIFAAGTLVGLSATLLYTSGFPTLSRSSSDDRVGGGHSARLTNPLLECAELPEGITVGERKDLEQKVATYIKDAVSAGKIAQGSVYFRDLNNGPWFGVNQTETFNPASLFKVPLAVTYYWQEANGTPLLADKIEFTGPPGKTVGFFTPNRALTPGTTYTVKELIERMLVDSDNDAAVILSQYLGLEERNRTYKDLGLRPLDNSQYSIDVHSYASMFRILYNATYIGQKNAEEILSVLTRSSFTKGIIAGVPNGTTVAHKFGEAVQNTSSGSQYQLHDCGIVYLPQKPYILCVMTKGKNMDALTTTISDISRMVYEGVK